MFIGEAEPQSFGYSKDAPQLSSYLVCSTGPPLLLVTRGSMHLLCTQLPTIHVCRKASSSAAVAPTQSKHWSYKLIRRRAVNLIAPGVFKLSVASFCWMASSWSDGFNKVSTWDAKPLPSWREPAGEKCRPSLSHSNVFWPDPNGTSFSTSTIRAGAPILPTLDAQLVICPFRSRQFLA